LAEPEDADDAPEDFRGKVLVTGAAGHLGANLVRRLLDERRPVRVLLREGSNNRAMDGLAVERVYGDLRDPDAVDSAVVGCETIFHSAGSDEDGRKTCESNIIGTQNLLAAAKAHAVRRVVCTGSFGATALPGGSDRLGDQDYDPSDAFPASERSHERTNMLMERECLRAFADGLDVVMVTSTAIVGPHDHRPSGLSRLLLDHAQGKLRVYVPGGLELVSARDIANGHMLAMRRGRPGQKYTIATSYLSTVEILDIFEAVTGVPRPRVEVPPRLMGAVARVTGLIGNLLPSVRQRFTLDAIHHLRRQRRADTSKARRELGFEPTPIEAAVRDAYDDFARRGLVPPRTAADPAPTRAVPSKSAKPQAGAAA
jgi:nucleoside-diphosphate-sugar epimerase